MNAEIDRNIEDIKDFLFLFKIRKEIDLNKSSVAILKWYITFPMQSHTLYDIYFISIAHS